MITDTYRAYARFCYTLFAVLFSHHCGGEMTYLPLPTYPTTLPLVIVVPISSLLRLLHYRFTLRCRLHSHLHPGYLQHRYLVTAPTHHTVTLPRCYLRERCEFCRATSPVTFTPTYLLPARLPHTTLPPHHILYSVIPIGIEQWSFTYIVIHLLTLYGWADSYRLFIHILLLTFCSVDATYPSTLHTYYI